MYRNLSKFWKIKMKFWRQEFPAPRFSSTRSSGELRILEELKEWGSLGSLVGGRGGGAWPYHSSCSECMWNALVVLLGLPTFDDTGSLGSHPRRVFYRPSVSALVTESRFLAGNREAKLKPTTFSSLLIFRVSLSFLFSYPHSDIALWVPPPRATR